MYMQTPFQFSCQMQRVCLQCDLLKLKKLSSTYELARMVRKPNEKAAVSGLSHIPRRVASNLQYDTIHDY